MIIFDLDGTLADCKHRQHFVDPEKNPDFISLGKHPRRPWRHKETGEMFKPDWESFYETCDQDTIIWPVFDVLCQYLDADCDISIWSGRPESVRDKTVKWLVKEITGHSLHTKEDVFSIPLKMRPVGDNTPDEQLKEKWLDSVIQKNRTIDFVFDSHPESIRMWRRRGIFVFNCCQNEGEF